MYFNFWKQVIAGYNPAAMILYGIDNFFNGRNAVFYTQFIGCGMWNRSKAETFWQSGRHPGAKSVFYFAAGVLGISRSALERYPAILQKWNCDEGENEAFALKYGNNEDPMQRVHKFNSSEFFS